MRGWLLLVALVALLPACGGRTSLVGPPGQRYDGRARDASLDGPHRRDGRPLDQRAPRDRQPIHDACLPIPASKVQGYYQGSWKGMWTCPGQQGQTVFGDLYFTLTPAGSPDSFNIKGSMTGYVDPGIPFSTQIIGSMNCTSLVGQLPKIVVGSGGIIYELTGSMTGTFHAYPQSLQNGLWKAQEKGGSCTASGSWYANQQ